MTTIKYRMDIEILNLGFCPPPLILSWCSTKKRRHQIILNLYDIFVKVKVGGWFSTSCCYYTPYISLCHHGGGKKKTDLLISVWYLFDSIGDRTITTIYSTLYLSFVSFFPSSQPPRIIITKIIIIKNRRRRKEERTRGQEERRRGVKDEKVSFFPCHPSTIILHNNKNNSSYGVMDNRRNFSASYFLRLWTLSTNMLMVYMYKGSI